MAELEIFAEDCGFPEGPVACSDGSVIFGELRSGRVIRAKPDGTKQVIAEAGGATAGLAVGPDGALYACNNGGFSWGPYGPESNFPIGPHPDYKSGCIQRIDVSTGKVEQLYDSCDGVKLAGPNDIMFDDKGGFWFTDLGVDTGTSELHGGLYYAKADGSSIRRIAYGLGLNGVGISPDGKTVYAACSFGRNMLAFDATLPKVDVPDFMAQAPGVKAEQGRGPAAGRVVASFPGHQILDSLAMEADGTIAQAIVLGAMGIGRVNPETGAVRMVETEDFLTTNIAFGGADMQTAFITLSSSGRIGKMRWDAPGFRLPYNL